MKDKKVLKRLLAGVLAAAVTVSAVVIPTAAEDGVRLKLTQVSSEGFSTRPTGDKVNEIENDKYADTDVVRVSIFLNDASTIKAGFDIDTIATDSKAIAYRDTLKAKQQIVEEKIEKATKENLDVVHNLTLAANVISANVQYGQIKSIEKISGVKAVVIENQYEAAKTVEDLPNDPNMSTSTNQIGSGVAWADGYTGAGTKIAVIDTGIATDHQSFDEAAYLYSLEQIAKEKGMTLDEYKATLDLLDKAAIEAVKDQLNVQIDVDKVSVSAKIPFAYNYVDLNYDITHANDKQGEHGSHVEGIAAANKYIKDADGNFVTAIDNVKVQGVAPDAQIITMKVFGTGGGAYDSDYMLAIEDAIVLGADSINLSLGSGMGGNSKHSNAEYQKIFEDITKSGAVVAISAGNSGHWADSAYTGGYLYADDVNTQTDGSPGSYTNAFTVASADNIGIAGEYFTIGETPVVYTQSTGYTNKPFTTLAGEQEYVYLDAVFDEEGNLTYGAGTEEEWAAIGDALKGKIAVCSRGGISFYQKAEFAVAAGAIATIVYNYQPGSINMDLSDYTKDAPCVSITQEEGALFKANGTVSADGKYYTGKIKVEPGVGTAIVNKGYSTISSFSSWGVPGSLELKPEITAPGGNIYSVHGYAYNDLTGQYAGGKDTYENMSGTSMAAPQVAGMSALAAQYIKENGLDEQTGLKARTLAQSLLMSTAEPMLEDFGEDGLYYYPVLRQGAGLANIGNVVKAESYILMDEDANAGAKDGKVKVELGDDPDKKGVYTFGFTIYNLTESAKAYSLSADIFSQYIAADQEGTLFMDTSTEFLNSKTEFDCGETAVVPANGKTHVTATITLSDEDKEYLSYFENGAYIEGYVYAAPYMMYDFNGDGKVNADDGQRLLDYRTGVETELYNKEYADLDEDGDIDTHDAYVFLNLLETGKLNVLNGEEGILGTTHSIPVFGFYGNWSTPSMFDKGTYVESNLAETETRKPYLYNETGLLSANAYGVTYPDDDGPHYLGGNVMVSVEKYYPERAAVNNTNGTVLSMVQFSAIRNAVDSRFTIYNETTKETILDTSMGAVTAAYYHANSDAWQNVAGSFKPGYNFSGAKEGEKVTMSFALAPEYYLDAEGNVRWEDIDMTNALTSTVTIDNTAPVIESASIKGNTLTVKAKDNQYIASIALVNKGNTTTYSFCGSSDTQKPGETAEYTLDVTDINADQLYLQVYDYALNATTYAVEGKFGEGSIVPTTLAFDAANGEWVTYDKATDTIEPLEGSHYSFTAAAVVDHIVYAVDENGVLYTMPEKDLSDTTRVISLSAIFGDDITVFDMAYDATTGTLYALVNGKYLAPIDLLNGTVARLYRTPFVTTTLAIDNEGTFYSNSHGTGKIYSYTLNTDPVNTDPVLIGQLGDDLVSVAALQAMEYDAASDTIGWTMVDLFSFLGISVPITTYVEIDPNAASPEEACTVKEDQFFYQLTSLIFPDKKTESKTPDWAKPTNEVADVLIDVQNPEVTMLKGSTMTLAADVLPWTTANKDVTWVSTDEKVATVSADGTVTAVSEGQAKIYAISKADETKGDHITVTVETLDITLEGALQDTDGNPMIFKWDMSKDETWSKLVDLGTSVESATINTNNGHMYLMDGQNYNMFEIDPKDGSTIASGAGVGLPYVDMAYSEMFSTKDSSTIFGLYGSYFLIESDPLHIQGSGYKLSSYLGNNTGASFFTAIANMGTTELEDPELGLIDVELFGVLDNANYLWIMAVYNDPAQGASLYDWLDIVDTGITETYEGMMTEDYVYTGSMVMGDDGVLYLSAFSVEDNRNNLYRIILEEGEEGFVCSSDFIGCTDDNVWPLVLTKVTANSPAAGNNAANGDVADDSPLRQSIKLPAEAKALKLDAFEKNFVREEAEKVVAEKVEDFEVATKNTLVDAAGDEEVNDGVGSGDTSADVQGDKIDVNIVAKDYTGSNTDTNNGLFNVKYDPAALEINTEAITVNSDYKSVKLDAAKGEITIGYVNPDAEKPIEAGEDAVNLEFTIKDETLLTEDSIVVDHVEVGELNVETPREGDPEISEEFFEEEKPLKEDEPAPEETTTTEPTPAETTTTEPGQTDPDKNQPTGIVIAVVPAVAAAAAVVLTKKRNKRK